MRNFSGNKRGGRFGGDRGGFGSDRGGFSGGRDRRDGGRSSLHKAICSECGNNCEVPFRPTGEKPVYCNDCFGGKKSREERGGFGGRSPKRDFGERVKAVSEKPVNDDTRKLLMEVISKLDRLTGIMENINQVKKEVIVNNEPVSEVKTNDKKKSETKKGKKETVIKAVTKKVTAKKSVKKK